MNQVFHYYYLCLRRQYGEQAFALMATAIGAQGSSKAIQDVLDDLNSRQQAQG